ncbi:MAG: hypothetical protein WBZ00_16230, partial [Solirubrobacterales bacterium]
FRFGVDWLQPASLAALIIVASQILDPPAAAGASPRSGDGRRLRAGRGRRAQHGERPLAVELESPPGNAPTRRRTAQDSG